MKLLKTVEPRRPQPQPTLMRGAAQGSKLVPVNRKTERRESKREAKAEVAAKVPQMIEMELLNRLRQGLYGGLHSLPQCGSACRLSSFT